MIETCANVMCSSSAITLSYNADLKLAVDGLNPTATDDGFEISCTLGECAMSHAIEDSM